MKKYFFIVFLFALSILLIKDVENNNKDIIKKNKIFVDIKGSVKFPNTYEVEEDFIVSDVIAIAGGLNDDADTKYINLSKKVENEMVIIVYSMYELKEFKYNRFFEYACNCPEIKNDICLTSNINKKVNIVNINTASIEELMTLTNIGKTKAEAIIKFRTLTPFKNIKDITKVSGIGIATFNKIKDFITV